VPQLQEQIAAIPVGCVRDVLSRTLPKGPHHIAGSS
jgi:hypothetical protein